MLQSCKEHFLPQLQHSSVYPSVRPQPQQSIIAPWKTCWKNQQAKLSIPDSCQNGKQFSTDFLTANLASLGIGLRHSVHCVQRKNHQPASQLQRPYFFHPSLESKWLFFIAKHRLQIQFFHHHRLHTMLMMAVAEDVDGQTQRRGVEARRKNSK